MTGKSNTTGIRSWPEEDRPREKLLKKGAGALSNSELLAILLRTGTHGISAIDLARKVLKKFGTFRNMAHTDSRDWKDLEGKHKLFANDHTIWHDLRELCDVTQQIYLDMKPWHEWIKERWDKKRQRRIEKQKLDSV